MRSVRVYEDSIVERLKASLEKFAALSLCRTESPGTDRATANALFKVQSLGPRLMMIRASVVMVVGVSSACSPSAYLANLKESTVDHCIRKSCTGPGVMEARDYQRCEAACRERIGK
jgi:hypothetical protein